VTPLFAGGVPYPQIDTKEEIRIPVTSIPVYPLGTFQVTLTAGISLGW